MNEYNNLIIYKQATLIYDLTYLFCSQYLNPMVEKRTIEQMQQAARSGKQNIVEGVLEKSSKLEINLLSVSRASFGELLEDYKDYLRTRSLVVWDKEHPKLLALQSLKITDENSVIMRWREWTSEPERFANLMITLLYKEMFMLDKFIAVLEKNFIETGGYSENLLKKRLNYRKNNPEFPI